MPTAPTLAEVKDYLGSDYSYSDDDITEAMEAEEVAQANICRFPADPEAPAEPLPYPHDLAAAFKRRVLRYLQMKAIPLGYQQTATEMGVINTRIGIDAEIRRFEAPHRKLVVG